MEKEVVKACRLVLMEQYTKVFGLMICRMVGVDLFMPMAIYIMENGLTIKHKAKVNIFIKKMEHST
jgi:hypothetical protein